MLAVCLAGTEAGEVRVKVLDAEHIEWHKHKYRLYMRCSASSTHSLCVFMRVRFFQPLLCTEEDLHPVAFPPPLSQGLFYGSLLLLDGSMQDFSLSQWQQAWSGMQNHCWSMSQDVDEDEPDEDDEDEEDEAGEADGGGDKGGSARQRRLPTVHRHGTESEASADSDDSDNGSEDDDEEEEEEEVEESDDSEVSDDASDVNEEEPPPELVVQSCKALPSKRQRRYEARVNRAERRAM